MKRRDDHWPIYRDLHTARQTATQLTCVPSGDVCESVYVEFSHTSVAHKVYRGVLIYREMTLPDFTAFVVRQCLEMGESGVVTGPGEEKKKRTSKKDLFGGPGQRGNEMAVGKLPSRERKRRGHVGPWTVLLVREGRSRGGVLAVMAC